MPSNPWHFIWVAVLAATFFSFVMNLIQSILWYGSIHTDLLVIGTIDAIVVSLIVAPFIIYFILAERKKAEARLLELSLTDDLTGLKNRRGFFTLAEHQLKLAGRTNTGLYLLYSDIDGFKETNDILGHHVGDRVLIEFADLLRQEYRETDIIGRMGGDEFAIFMPGTSSDEADTVARRFKGLISEYDIATGVDNSNRLSISFGITYYDPAEPRSLDELLVEADNLMYKDKKQRFGESGRQ